MPNRILRDGILTSERVNSLSWEGEIFYRRLMSVVDDHGLYPAHPALLRAALYPLKLETVRDANVERLISECEKARLVRVYEVESKSYLQLLNFGQQVRSKPKHPKPPDSNCAQPPAIAHLVGGVVGDEGGGGGGNAAPIASDCHSDPDPPGFEPDLETYVSTAAGSLIPRWFAEKHWQRFSMRGWRDGRTPIYWRKTIPLIHSYFENDGRPMNAPRAATNGALDEEAKLAALQTDWEAWLKANGHSVDHREYRFGPAHLRAEFQKERAAAKKK
jgi:hypothetical protein